MMSECKFCNKLSVDHTLNEPVCVNCGIVADVANLSQDVYTAQTSYVPFSSRRLRIQQTKNLPITLRHGKSVLDYLCHQNNITDVSLKENVNSKLKHFCEIRRFRYKEDAGITAACCLFLELRKKKQAIAIKKICDQAQCTRGKFSFFLKYVKSHLKESKEISADAADGECSPNISAGVSGGEFSQNEENLEGFAVLDTAKSMIREVCSGAEKEEQNVLMEKTAALIELANSCWLLTGRSPRSVVVASAYLCWKSLKPARKKASFAAFCKALEISEPVARLRIRELKAFLLKLGQKIPSYDPDYVNEDNLLFHLDCILQNSETLRNDLLPDIHARNAVHCKEYESFRIPTEPKRRREPVTSVIYDSDMNASDVEISDSEIQSYICRDAKKKFIKLCEEDEDDFSSS